eukprot:3633724-Amphidinium_carterae.1
MSCRVVASLLKWTKKLSNKRGRSRRAPLRRQNRRREQCSNIIRADLPATHCVSFTIIAHLNMAS